MPIALAVATAMLFCPIMLGPDHRKVVLGVEELPSRDTLLVVQVSNLSLPAEILGWMMSLVTTTVSSAEHPLLGFNMFKI